MRQAKKPLTPERLSSAKRYALAHLYVTREGHPRGLNDFEMHRREVRVRTIASLRDEGLVAVRTSTFADSTSVAFIYTELVPEYLDLAKACWESIPVRSRPSRSG